MARKGAVWLTTLLFGIILLIGCARAAHATTVIITVTAWEDGTDNFNYQGGNLWITHQAYQNPTNITVTTVQDGVTVQNNVAFNPTWNGSTSSDFSLVPALPLAPMTTSLTVISARDYMTLTQSPDATNNYTTIVNFNDGPSGGAAWYTSQLTYTFAALPEPPIACLLLSALALPAILRRRRVAATRSTSDRSDPAPYSGLS